MMIVCADVRVHYHVLLPVRHRRSLYHTIQVDPTEVHLSSGSLLSDMDMTNLLSKRGSLSLEDLESKQRVSMADLGFKSGTMDAPYDDILKMKQAKPKRTTVSLGELYTPQSTVNVDQLLKFTKKSVAPYKIKSNNSAFRPEAKYPQVIKYNGKMYIADGNHRLAASKILGHTSAEVLLYEI